MASLSALLPLACHGRRRVCHSWLWLLAVDGGGARDTSGDASGGRVYFKLGLR
jgi:hypothetical protein